MKQIVFGIFFILSINILFAEDEIYFKRIIKSSMKEVYKVFPSKVDSVSDMFTEGMFYGRLRFNSFGFRWNDELELKGKTVRKDHAIGAIGGSIIYKSAYLNGLAFTAGLYAGKAAGTLDNNEAYLYKSGKGVISRYNMLNDGQSYIASLAQAYLEYNNKYFFIKAGRIIFESFLTASNDTKMVPNTFEGAMLETHYFPYTVIKSAYLSRQKLRDHSTFHHVLACGDKLANGKYNIYSQNDDSAMHFGLSKSKLEHRGIKDRLIVIDGENNSFENFTFRVNYTAVPNLISSVMIQTDYRFDVDNLAIIPALRYMQQFDNGAGAIGGANLKTLTSGYGDPQSLDSWLFAARVDLKQDAWKLRLGYTNIADKGDLIAPWRGFPTSGFTRSMSQYNWYANTKTYMIRADYDFDKAGLVSNLKVFMRYAVQDFDDNKIGVQADSNVMTLDILKEFTSYPGLYMKFRMAHVVGDDNTVVSVNGVPKTKLDPSYDEARFEINYLF